MCIVSLRQPSHAISSIKKCKLPPSNVAELVSDKKLVDHDVNQVVDYSMQPTSDAFILGEFHAFIGTKDQSKSGKGQVPLEIGKAGGEMFKQANAV